MCLSGIQSACHLWTKRMKLMFQQYNFRTTLLSVQGVLHTCISATQNIVKVSFQIFRGIVQSACDRCHNLIRRRAQPNITIYQFSLTYSDKGVPGVPIGFCYLAHCIVLLMAVSRSFSARWWLYSSL